MKKISLIGKAASLTVAAVMALGCGGTVFAEWKETENGKMYLDENSKPVTGFQEIDGQTYYFRNDGTMKTSGWIKMSDGKRYYFGSNGIMRKGWLKTSDGKFYLTDNGAAVGITEIEDDIYYFSKQGIMQSGWLKSSKGRYYFGRNGAAYKGFKKVGSSYYFFDEKCIMQTGWQKTDGGKRYFNENGKMAVSKTVTIDGKNYEFDDKGLELTEERKKEIEEAETIYPTAIVVYNDKIPMKIGDSFKVNYNFKPINSTYREVKFKSSNSRVVSVDEKGTITAKQSGKATITITSKHDSDVYVKFDVEVAK